MNSIELQITRTLSLIQGVRHAQAVDRLNQRRPSARLERSVAVAPDKHVVAHQNVSMRSS